MKLGKILFETKDHCMVMQRDSEIYSYDDKTQIYILNTNAREHGVKVISTTKNGINIICIVEWL